MKIGIFGGTFDPVHKEHVQVALQAIEQLHLDQLLIMPSYQSPHKQGKAISSAEDRLAMCRLAFTDPREEISTYEIERGGTSYSYLTCRYFKEKLEGDQLFFLVGTDMLEDFYAWRNPRDILANATLAVCRRHREREYLVEQQKLFTATFGVPFAEVDYNGADVSSTEVRTIAALGGNLGELLPKEVCDYVTEKKLYLHPVLSQALDLEQPARRAHSVRVAVMAVAFAKMFGVSEEQALTAAALHDVAKNLAPNDKRLQGFVVPNGVPSPVVHQFSGAYVAEHSFGITDGEVLDAIRYHTSGKPNMTKLGKLIFLSDLLESGREYDGVDSLRALFLKDADECIKEALKRQVEHVRGRGLPVYPLTEEAYRFYQGK